MSPAAVASSIAGGLSLPRKELGHGDGYTGRTELPAQGPCPPRRKYCNCGSGRRSGRAVFELFDFFSCHLV